MVAQGSIHKLNLRLEKWDANIEAINGALNDIGLRSPIDEVAVMFNNKASAYSFIETLVAAGGEMFNAASDAVETYPLRSKYLVDYLFCNPPGERSYRVECMVIQKGHSPLHAALHLSSSSFEPTVHYSFKTQGGSEYAETRRTLEGFEWTLAQSCLSEYGAFSYYLMDESSIEGLVAEGNGEAAEAYIKPRVNLRDASPKGREHAVSKGHGYLSRKAI